jgi:hypothetical protein
MSRRVRLKYWSLPTSARYSVGEGKGSPKFLSSWGVAVIGVDAGLASAMPDLWRRSVMYFRCERNMPAAEGIVTPVLK